MSGPSTNSIEPRATRCVVLVEGASDRIAVETVAQLLGHDLAGEGVAIVAMGGITNLRSSMEAHLDAGADVIGLLDEGEMHVARSVLRRLGRLEPDQDLADAGFHVCRRDLEDELLRALGVDAVLGLVESNGDLPSYEIFSNQPDQRARSDHDRLRRFAGTRSGRKAEYARLLARALRVDSIPSPLRNVLGASALDDLQGNAGGGAIH